MADTLDLSTTAADDGTGKIAELSNADALRNSLQHFVSMTGGDVLGFPQLGGLLDGLMFKNFNSSAVQNIVFDIYTNITENFTEPIEVRDIQITPDYSKRLLSIVVLFVNPISNKVDSVSNYYKLNAPQEKTLKLVDVDYISDNLLAFCMTNKSQQPKELLTFDAFQDKFIWGIYRFINLKNTDSKFADILSVCNLQ